jgi:hypothetical protein
MLKEGLVIDSSRLSFFFCAESGKRLPAKRQPERKMNLFILI